MAHSAMPAAAASGGPAEGGGYQTAEAEKAPGASAYLMLFDRREATRGQPWDGRLSRAAAEGGITVPGCRGAGARGWAGGR